MNGRLAQALILIIISVVVAFSTNAVRQEKLALVGNWPSMSGSDSVIVPPSAQEGDPPFISLDEAAAKFQSSEVLFIDSRDPEDYEYGHIRGAINLPYEELELYWDQVSPQITDGQPLVLYCSGDECETSLMLAREMVLRGWDDVYVFFGGWREWEKAGLPVKRGKI